MCEGGTNEGGTNEGGTNEGGTNEGERMRVSKRMRVSGRASE